jgi:cytoskeletal protein CcmA (bactofilin family)
MWKKSESEVSNVPNAPNVQPIRPAAPNVQPAQAPSASPSHATRERAIIGATVAIKGDLTGGEDLLIEGSVEGKVELRDHSVTIGKNGRIKADVHARTITVEGNVEGNLYGEEQIIVRQSGTVRGNIVSARVALEDGSNFKGNIDMSPKDKPRIVSNAQGPSKS